MTVNLVLHKLTEIQKFSESIKRFSKRQIKAGKRSNSLKNNVSVFKNRLKDS